MPAFNRSFLFCFGILCFLSSAHADGVKKSEFMNVTRMLMSAPCTNAAYLSCLKMEKSLCETAMNASIKACDEQIKIPESIPRNTLQKTIGGYAACVKKQFKIRSRLSDETVKACAPVLKPKVKSPATSPVK